MTIKLTAGEKARRANIRAMKAIGVRNARLKAARAAEHVERNIDRAILATVQREERRLAGIARRDAHNAALRLQASRPRLELGERTASVPVAANDDQQLAMAV